MLLANPNIEPQPGSSYLGNTQADQQVFQIDDNFTHYCQTKLLASGEENDTLAESAGII
ncbi:hypothetical protein [Nostoc sp. DedQUE09]|uniref:hypothetical protein n=1 Tax=Nostoc sp. DedQUE09 TaxID=3075394 RepID=UPI002AD24A95|nr:hypothetical protein [Nostoc sp. DedQUE09]